MKISGRIELIIGPMFAGKTSELLRRLERHEYAKKKCLLIFSKKDTVKKTHRNEDKIGGISVKLLMNIPKDILKLSRVVGIDEGQFFPDLIEFCEYCANDLNKVVIVAALDGDFNRDPFGETCQLISRAEKVDKLTSVCMICSNHDASFSKRITDEKEIEKCGGLGMYLACCRGCYMNNKKINGLID